MPRPKLLTDNELKLNLVKYRNWTHVGKSITRTVKCGGFPDAVALVQRIVAPAEAMNHHPDIDVRYNKVTITISTHDQGGLTALDFLLAEKIDSLI